jgi:hypothetical protein
LTAGSSQVGGHADPHSCRITGCKLVLAGWLQALAATSSLMMKCLPASLPPRLPLPFAESVLHTLLPHSPPASHPPCLPPLPAGSMPYAQQHYPFENKERFEGGFPADFVAEGLDQVGGCAGGRVGGWVAEWLCG